MSGPGSCGPTAGDSSVMGRGWGMQFKIMGT